MKNKTFVLQFLGYELRVKSYQILILLGILITYFSTRIFNLTQLPVFCDEAIYIRWSQVMRHEPSLRFMPLQDGKQPLFMWLTIPFLKIFENPLVAGRMVSILAGFGTLIGVIALPIIISQSVNLGLLSGLIYVLAPFGLFFDRMALVDSLLTAFGVWSLNLSLILAKTKRLDVAMILGMVLGGALITKSPGMIFVGLAVLTVVLFSFRRDNHRIVPTILLLTVSLCIAFLIHNILRLGPNFHMLAIRNQDYVRDFDQIIASPFQPTINLFGDMIRYYWYYFTPVLFVFGLIGILGGVRRFKFLNFIILFSWFLLPLLGQSLISQGTTARYILFTLPVFVVFSGYGLHLAYLKIKEITGNLPATMILRLLAMTILFLPAIIFNYHLWFSPARASLPKDERKGYLEDWTAGWGLVQVADYLKNQPENETVVVGTEGFFGTMPDGLQIYLGDQENITVIGSAFPVKTIPDSLLDSATAENETYLVVNRSRYKIESEEEKGLELIESYQKPGGDELLFFKLKLNE